MKLIKIISFCLLFLLSISSTFAFTISEFNTSKEKYKVVLEKKILNKLEKLSEENLEKLHKKVIILIDRVEKNAKISDNDKLKKLSLLFALEEIIKNQYTVENESNVEEITIKIIEDKRCSNCRVEQLIDNLKNIPVLSDVVINRVDFSED